MKKARSVARLALVLTLPVWISAWSAQPGPASAQEATFGTRSLTPETALKAASAALETCRKQGFQVSVAVVDRSGVVQVLLRDRFGGAQTPDTAINKAWTAASFKMPTSALAEETQPGKAQSGIRQLPRIVAVGGGLPIEAAGSLVGAIGVSGAPGAAADEACAKAGVKAISDLLELQG
jgi:uncharacterized protein GlcG (DUF336 family)